MNIARARAGALVSHLSPVATGLLLISAIAVAARLLGSATPLPPVFFALVLGMACSGFASNTRCAPGIAFGARDILRIGVALLGVQITLGDMLALGPWTGALTLVSLALALLVGSLVARAFGCSRDGSMVSAGAVAICGASAALAIAAALPKGSVREEEVARTVAGITVCGTVAMLTFPTLALWLGLDSTQTGIFLGGTIHEVAQAVAAGFAVSDDVGQVATLVKLLRVATLGAVVVAVGLIARGAGAAAEPNRLKTPLLPSFLVIFVLLAAISSLGVIPAPLREMAGEISRWCLLIAIAALGVRTSFAKLVAAGSGPLLAITANSFLLAALVLGGIWMTS